MTRQSVLPLTLPAIFSEGNFYTGACNQDAYDWIMRWPNWPNNALLLYGPAGSGKSHLGHIWTNRANAVIYNAKQSLPAPTLIKSHMLIENIEAAKDDRELLHLLNYSKEKQVYVLLTSALPPKQLPFSLPDLTSRLLALPAACIDMPDEEILAAALRKQFADRQLKVDEDMIGFLLPRMERSFAGAARLVDQLDTQALAEQKSLTIPFIKRALGY